MKQSIDSIVCNGYILTMDDANTEYPHGAIAIDASNIVAIGSAQDILSCYRSETVIDVAGDAILPGFINGHTHSAMTLLRGVADSVDLTQWLTQAILPLEELIVDGEIVYAGTRLALLEMIENGITTCVDMYLYPDAVASACQELGMRAIVGANIRNKSDDIPDAASFITRWHQNRLITPAVAPHAPHTVPVQQLRESRDLAEQYQVPLLMHVAETLQEQEYMLNTYGKRSIPFLREEGLLNNRLIAAHGVHLTDHEIEAIALAGAGIIHCPISNLKLGSGIAPLTKMAQYKAATGLGTDGAASNNSLSILESVKMAILLQRAYHTAPFITAYEGLMLATRGAAQAIHRQHAIGSLEVGKKADIISIALSRPHQLPSYHPTSTIAFASRTTDIRTVIIDGQLLLNNGIHQRAASTLHTIIEDALGYKQTIEKYMQQQTIAQD